MDPRVRRTRLLLQQALADLLEKQPFDKLSVQDIAEAATVNRATFYDHYSDKTALLKCLVARRFHELLAEHGVKFDGTCAGALRGLVLGVCDYISRVPGMCCQPQREIDPHLESAVIEVVRRMILEGLNKHRTVTEPSNEMIASMASWAIYGGAKQWAQTPDRPPSEEIAQTVMRLMDPLLSACAH